MASVRQVETTRNRRVSRRMPVRTLLFGRRNVTKVKKSSRSVNSVPIEPQMADPAPEPEVTYYYEPFIVEPVRQVETTRTRSSKKQVVATPVRQVVPARTRRVFPSKLSAGRNVTTTVTRSSGHWTYPGSIDSHLAGSPHYVSRSRLATMTYEQKLDLHDSLHEGG